MQLLVDKRQVMPSYCCSSRHDVVEVPSLWRVRNIQDRWLNNRYARIFSSRSISPFPTCYPAGCPTVFLCCSRNINSIIAPVPSDSNIQRRNTSSEYSMNGEARARIEDAVYYSRIYFCWKEMQRTPILHPVILDHYSISEIHAHEVAIRLSVGSPYSLRKEALTFRKSA
jgi:hypothetical protein